MKKITSLTLTLLIVFSNIFFLASCSPTPTPEPEDQRPPASIVVPGRVSYSRPVVSYSDVKYERPDVKATAEAIKSVAAKIEEGAEFKKGTELIDSIEDGYVSVNTMYTVAEINFMRNSLDEYWAAEYEYMSTEYPSFSEALEDLFVACAQSEDKERYENEYFMSSLDDYVDGGIYTDALVLLFESEATLEAEYMNITEEKVKFDYDSRFGTYAEHLEAVKEAYGTNSATYNKIVEECTEALQRALKNERRGKFVELVKIRSKIAEELGYESYSEYAYEAMGYEYTADEMMNILNQLSSTVYPVYIALYDRAFRSFFYSSTPSENMPYATVNNLYDLYSSKGGIVDEAYSYMLKCGLYDIDVAKDGRYAGAFTAQIYELDAPFLFMTADGYVTDYITLSHEYGHFLDGYINGARDTSLDLAEISSQAMEFMTVLMLEGMVSDKDLQFLEYYQMYSSLEILLIQGYYSMFEHKVYELGYSEINEQALDRVAAEASMATFGQPIYKDFSSVLIQHTAIYPHYVQSYCTSLISSLEIFFAEVENEGDGMKIYLDLITRDSEEYLTYKEELLAVGLSSPFETETLKWIVDSIHYQILGSHYFMVVNKPNTT